jgi:predicted deacetylase
MKVKYILRFDDITPGMAMSKFLPLKHVLEELNIYSVLGVVPDCRDPKLYIEDGNSVDFFNYVRSWKKYGDTIAQHGTYHVYDSLNSGILKINKNSEFAGHEYDIQLEKLKSGKEILLRENVWQPYFMAPSHSFDKNTLKALSALGFEKLTDGYGFFPYRLCGVLLVPQLFSIPISFGFGYLTICVHINSMSQDQINELINFIRANRSKFVDFKKIKDLNRVYWLPAVIIRYFTFLSLVSFRFFRKICKSNTK